MKRGPIILVEDDVDDQEFVIDALQALRVENEVLVFDNGKKALDYLLSTQRPTFLIISDVNVPVMNGIQLKEEIQKNDTLRDKSIPFIFLTTTAERKAVKEAFLLSAQGFFVKENTYEGIQKQLGLIINYWRSSTNPNNNEP